ncbi:hypothetical protein [Corynebacterium efficiens]|uniref:Uncharacterized protein n=1 Tax=Corynebacterium efficiens (strain DSM 44549 / YS-314 / AJ 12310 / JCM 11189 / NBRC 100395) TaxID=196164 RepID=Q8FM90_COREF|nr:hypothetical protein [Corynebacterium efficiens]BAC19427.1 hypothetical protein [Corynebacterium efficiens YS-314]
MRYRRGSAAHQVWRRPTRSARAEAVEDAPTDLVGLARSIHLDEDAAVALDHEEGSRPLGEPDPGAPLNRPRFDAAVV